MARLELGVSENDTNHIVLATIAHKKHYVELAHSLWPTSTKEDLAATYHDIVPSSRNRILFYKENNEIVAFMHLSIREDYVEGSESSPTGYVEGVFVLEEHRRKGFSKKLLHAGESWLKARGCQQIGSDIHLENEISYYFHTSLGFQESSRLIAFIKSIE
ncbi:aminoglycoside 6'-N-acetyltransferase [Sutcliffiella rhizosphaerae]|nr:aminoglycoside 6'-N-acetyltransferase [Sutcliffiella rhizosphaerae]